MCTLDIPALVRRFDWEKRWMERNNLLTCSLAGEQFYFANKKQWGVSFDHGFFIYREGMVICYQLISENSAYGSNLANRLSGDTALLDVWCQDASQKTKTLLEYLQTSAQELLEKSRYQKFIQLFNSYLPAIIAITRPVNFLSPDLLETMLPPLQKVRFETETAYGQVDTFLGKFLTALADRAKRDPALTQLLYTDEVRAYFESGSLPTDTELAERTPVSGLYFEDGRRLAVNREDTELFEKLVAELVALTPGEVRGSTAVKGVAHGTVRIVHDPKKVTLFNAGDILITSMTNPEFVPLMKKAGAVVTDGGGILCHAAIVARELGTPCVINTQVATRTFQDGDMVEVDATKGTVYKL